MLQSRGKFKFKDSKGKGEDLTKYLGYQPVSVLPHLSLLFESVLSARLVGFLDRHRVIVPGQYGFRSGHSTAMAVLDMVERVRGAWGRGNAALGVFIDLKKIGRASCRERV